MRLRRLFHALFAAALALSSPALGAKADHETKERTHTVGAGQTLAKIAKRYGVSVDELREANSLKHGQKLHEGMKLVIPGTLDPKKADKKEKGEKGDEPRDKKEKDKGDDDADKDQKEEKEDKDKKKKDKDDEVPKGHVRLVRGDVTWEGKVKDDKGRVTKAARAGFAKVLASEDGKKHAISGKLISIVAEISDHFGGRTLEVASGFRPKGKKSKSKSRHASGDAIDLHVAGVSNPRLRDFCKTLEKTGCGFYPNGTFVHVDTRDKSFAWTDLSRPGEAPRYEKSEHEKGAEAHGDGDKSGDDGSEKTHKPGSGSKRKKKHKD